MKDTDGRVYKCGACGSVTKPPERCSVCGFSGVRFEVCSTCEQTVNPTCSNAFHVAKATFSEAKQLAERLRKVAADDRRLAINANEYFHRHQDRAGWYNAVIKGEYKDRSDYAPTLERCAMLEEAAKMLEGL